MSNSSNLVDMTFWIILAAATIVFVIALLVLCKIRKRRSTFTSMERIKISNSIEETSSGVEMREVGRKKKIGRKSIKIDIKHKADLVPHTTKREIRRESFAVKELLGSGNFGEVNIGELYGLHGPNSKTKVAIKSTKKEGQLDDFLQEIKVMSYIKPHLNLVSMIGSCGSETKMKKEMWLVLEFCGHGDLKKFLNKNKKEILSGQKNGSMDDRCLVYWAHDIAKGMDHLYSHNIMHGDLAARNILLADNPIQPGQRPVAKVADFGLSKKFYNNLRYEKQKRVYTPWRWMAPEYLTYDFFTLKSDVWSYGIVLWEILSFGRIPYGHTDPDEVVAQIEDGYRLPCPTDVTCATLWSPETFYKNISQVCFVNDPDDRGIFADVIKVIENELLPEEMTNYDDMSKNYESVCCNSYLTLGGQTN